MVNICFEVCGGGGGGRMSSNVLTLGGGRTPWRNPSQNNNRCCSEAAQVTFGQVQSQQPREAHGRHAGVEVGRRVAQELVHIWNKGDGEEEVEQRRSELRMF